MLVRTRYNYCISHLKTKLNKDSLKPNLGLVLALLAIVAAACASAQPTADVPTTAASATPPATDIPLPPSVTDTAAAPPPNLIIEPATLGQLRLLWNINFPGDLASDPNCYTSDQECTLSTNVAAYAFSPDGSTLAVSVCLGTRTHDTSQPEKDEWGCTAESAIILYDAATGAEHIRLAPAALPLSLAFHPDGAALAAGLANSDIELWALPSGDQVGTLTGSPIYVGVSQLAFTPHENLLIGGSKRSLQIQIQIWDWPSGNLVTTLDHVYGFAISPDGATLAALHFVVYGDVVRVYSLPQAHDFSEIPFSDQFDLTLISFNSLNGWISMGDSYLVKFWDPASSAMVASLDYIQDLEKDHVEYDLNSGGFTSGGYFLLGRSGALVERGAQPDVVLFACGFALADMQANQIFFSPPMLFDECTSPDYMYDTEPTRMSKILSPDGRFIAADDGFGNLRVWGIDSSVPPIPPECSWEC